MQHIKYALASWFEWKQQQWAQYDDLSKAASLAKWLIEDKGQKRKTAYIIAQRKYKLPDYGEVRKEYNRIKKIEHARKQPKLL